MRPIGMVNKKKNTVVNIVHFTRVRDNHHVLSPLLKTEKISLYDDRIINFLHPYFKILISHSSREETVAEGDCSDVALIPGR